MRFGIVSLLGVLGLATGAIVSAQQIQLGDLATGQGAVRRQHVELETDALQVRPGRPDWIELRFRVDAGFHINSHTPKDELLVPTELQVVDTSQLRISGQQYPAGVPLRLDVGEGEVLSTYQGEFRVRLQVTAKPGEGVLDGTLHYQACDARSCFPPRSLPVHVALTAR